MIRAFDPASSASRPLLGIGCCQREFEGEQIHRVIDRYVQAPAAVCDADIVLVPAMEDVSASVGLSRRLDGLLLTGSTSNMMPARYGKADGNGPFDPARDATSLRLAAQMVEAGKPVFGICRGFQELNVLFGGKLCDLPHGEVQHHAPDTASLEEMFAQSHQVELTDGGVLAQCWQTGHATVNSVHFQGIERLGNGLQVEAMADDSLVEAFSQISASTCVMAVQWHPEWDFATNPQSHWFFAALGAAMRGDALPKITSALPA
ncbi:gamma-glutamyl-gamma-aminobutyrate hydrolase family protein [Novosphingobium taihuense]|uniref:Putative glutamine amidotransferase n=1 Tax=Novosphingobium taihuense TaxID=260085 RepID=A0A7W7EUP3_9SPHN|nr:gamma-glutamyl-gamma-aminobutyrate hydrolase family protein [Novosphingobium taihuense]MBB4614194.1 putative glutamine amidotransferase [Novosphingobium taihuense]TWH87043.1 putative glutamine amidotransferase [Novosphingobium taihuense]